MGNPIFVAAPSYEHTPSDLLGTFHNVSGVGFYFEEQSTYLRLQDNELYLNNDWQIDFETNNIYKPSDIDPGAIDFINLASERQVPFKFGLDLAEYNNETNFDWFYADLIILNVDESTMPLNTVSPWEMP